MILRIRGTFHHFSAHYQAFVVNLNIDQASAIWYLNLHMGILLTCLMPCESCCEAATAGTALERGATIWEPPAEEDTEEAAGYISC